LNGPYPGICYLRSFLESRGYTVAVRDHSIALFHRIFCREGLARIFAAARRNYERYGTKDTRTEAETAAAHQDGSAGDPAFIPDFSNRAIFRSVSRFFSEEDRWLSSIDRITNFLRGADNEWGHFLSLANGVLPGGPRFDSRLAALGGEASPGSASLLASALLADMADFITVTLDPHFSLIRYLPRTGGGGFGNFDALRKALDGYILTAFYRPFLEEEWRRLEQLYPRKPGCIVGTGIPFPGCLAGALVCAESVKKFSGGRAVTVAGGGYVNTELRFMEDKTFFDYVDYLSFDRGYGSWEAILEAAGNGEKTRPSHTGAEETPVFGPLHNTMYRPRKNGDIIGAAVTGRGTKTDHDSVKYIFPGYEGIDFSQYLCPVDDENPMFRLWSGGRWLKAYLAHGCYWHNCAFCDVGLDYIRAYEPVDPEALFKHLLRQAEQTGVRGVHLVDEAAPPASLIRLARLNRAAGLPLIFWGNIRFEKTFTPDAAALLAAGGLIGVSGGIEIACEAGFKRIGKGLGIRDVIRVCAAFKEAGILTHGYLIYGYWDQDEQEIIDSAETLRQLFTAGLLDSAFWHKFVLTRHSRIYAEWEQGRHPGLRVRETARPGGSGHPVFACNDLSFEGEETYSRYTEGLDQLLAAWMGGDYSRPVDAAFPFPVKLPAVHPGMTEAFLDEYARNRDADHAAAPDPQNRKNVLFLGSKPLVNAGKKKAALSWRWKLEDRRVIISAGASGEKNLPVAEKTSELLENVSHPGEFKDTDLYRELRGLWGEQKTPSLWKALRMKGLVCY
jgi:radical SAM superfamily enzyme YgiQ (UPF0313 family)